MSKPSDWITVGALAEASPRKPSSCRNAPT
jgi:hypothetical protein